jgi:hypothetical protein
MLEPNPDFYASLYTIAIDCNHEISYFDTVTKTWTCPWDVNSKSNWLTTDGTKIVVNTNLAPASTIRYTV